MLSLAVFFMIFTPLFVIYCVFSYLFVYGVYHNNDAGNELKEAYNIVMAPVTFPYILGQVLMSHHKVNNKALATYKWHEDLRAAKEKEKAAEEKAKKEFMDELKKMGMVMDFSEIFGRHSRPKESGFAKQFNDLMRDSRNNPFKW